MLTIPALKVQQFGVTLYEAAFPAADIQKLVRFEVLSYQGSAGHGKRRRRTGLVNWGVLEKRIAASEHAYQRPIIRKKIRELTEYFAQCAQDSTLPAIPGAVLLVSDRPLDFKAAGKNPWLGLLQVPEEEGVLRALDGQHRLLALDAFLTAKPAGGLTVPAIVFDGLAAEQAVEMFVTINSKQTKINSSHIIALAGRRLFADKLLALCHDVVRSLNERQDSALHDTVKILGVGRGRVTQASLVEELKRVIDPKMDAEAARAFYRTYFNQVAQVFDEAWNGRKYSIKTGLALRAFLRMAPEVMKRVKDGGADPADALAIRRLVEPWKERIGSRRFETEGEWRAKLAGGSRGTVDLLAGELMAALGS